VNGLSEVADLADELMSFSVIFIKGVCFGALGLWGFGALGLLVSNHRNRRKPIH
jgi:hypothetical protein